jgi:hypothetical protein
LLLLRLVAGSVALLAGGGVLFAQNQAAEARQGQLAAAVERSGALRFAIGCSEAHACRVRFGNTVRLIKNSASVKPSGPASGLVFLYVEPSGGLAAGSAANLSCEGCKYVHGVTQFPSNTIPLFTATIVKGAFTATTDYLAQLSTENIVSGPGILLTENEGMTTVAADPTVVSIRSGAPPRTSSSACSTGQFAFDSDYYYICVASNKWKRIALSNF